MSVACRGSSRTSTGGRKWSAGSTYQRGAATAVRTSTPPSTTAETNWAWTCGWASPPMAPATIHGRRLAGAEQHPGEERVERPLARFEHVRMGRVQAEVAATVLVVEPGGRVHHARSEAEVVGLDEADRVAIADPRRRGRWSRRRTGWWPGPVGRPARGSIRAARLATWSRPSRRSTGTSRNVGSVRNASRSAIASLEASIPRWIQAGSVTPVGPNADAAGASNRARIARISSATRPELLGGWVVTRTPR